MCVAVDSAKIATSFLTLGATVDDTQVWLPVNIGIQEDDGIRSTNNRYFFTLQPVERSGGQDQSAGIIA